MENKQTAVEWLVDKLMKGEVMNNDDELIQKAKQMEKQQIMKAYYEGMQTNFDPNYGIALNYYESTYGK